MRSGTRGAASVGLLLAACTALDVPDLNDAGVDQLLNHPTRALISAAATGLIRGARVGLAGPTGYVAELGVLGREAFNLDRNNTQLQETLLTGPLDGGDGSAGGAFFAAPYGNIRAGNILLRALANVSGPAMTTQEIEGVTGFVQTMQALAYLQVSTTRDDLGAPIDVDIDPVGPPAPIASRAALSLHIANLLDSANMHLLAGGDAFSFPLSSGFAGFDAPATFAQFNRGLRARVAVYVGDYAGALTALSQSFLDPAQPLTRGVSFTFSTISGDGVNRLFDASLPDTARPTAIWAHPSILEDAQLQPDSQPDRRVLDKTHIVRRRTVNGITDSLKFIIYRTNLAPIPIIRNEELLLLRAEANIGLNNAAAALPDLDLIRTMAGGLASYAGPVTPAALLDELLYNRRYSLLFEGGHRWIDLRRYGRLDSLPRARPGDRVFRRFPFPRNECLARHPAPDPGCTPELGE